MEKIKKVLSLNIILFILFAYNIAYSDNLLRVPLGQYDRETAIIKQIKNNREIDQFEKAINMYPSRLGFPPCLVDIRLKNSVLNAVKTYGKTDERSIWDFFISKQIYSRIKSFSVSYSIQFVGDGEVDNIIPGIPIYFDVSDRIIYIARGFFEKFKEQEKYNLYLLLQKTCIFWLEKRTEWELLDEDLHKWMSDNYEHVLAMQRYWEENGSIALGLSECISAFDVSKTVLVQELVEGQLVDRLGENILCVGDETVKTLLNGSEYEVIEQKEDRYSYEYKRNYIETKRLVIVARGAITANRQKIQEILNQPERVYVGPATLPVDSIRSYDFIRLLRHAKSVFYDYPVRVDNKLGAKPEIISPLRNMPAFLGHKIWRDLIDFNNRYKGSVWQGPEMYDIKPDVSDDTTNIVSEISSNFISKYFFIRSLGEFDSFLLEQVKKYVVLKLENKPLTGINVRMAINEYFKTWGDIFDEEARKLIYSKAIKAGLQISQEELSHVRFAIDQGRAIIYLEKSDAIGVGLKNFINSNKSELEKEILEYIERYILTWYFRNKSLNIALYKIEDPIISQMLGDDTERILNTWYYEADTYITRGSGTIRYREPFGWVSFNGEVYRPLGGDILRLGNGIWLPHGPEGALELVSRGMGSLEELFIPNDGLLSPLLVKEYIDRGIIKDNKLWRVDRTLHDGVAVTETPYGGSFYGNVVFYFRRKDLDFSTDITYIHDMLDIGFKDTMFGRDVGEKKVKKNIPWSKVYRIFMTRNDYEKYLRLLEEQGLREKRLFGTENKRFEDIVTIVEKNGERTPGSRQGLNFIKTITTTFMSEYLDAFISDKGKKRREFIISETRNLIEKAENAGDSGIDIADISKEINIDQDSIIQALIDSGSFKVVSSEPVFFWDRVIKISTRKAEEKPFSWSDITTLLSDSEIDFVFRQRYISRISRNFNLWRKGEPYRKYDKGMANYNDVSLDELLSLPAVLIGAKSPQYKLSLEKKASELSNFLHSIIFPEDKSIDDPLIKKGRLQILGSQKATLSAI